MNDLLKIAEWRDGNYYDSERISAYWDTTQKVVKTNYTDNEQECSLDWTETDIEDFRQSFQQYIFDQLKKDNEDSIYNPKKLAVGQLVKFKAAKNCRKWCKTTECEYCENGQWENPYNPFDKRDCYHCNGLNVSLSEAVIEALAIEQGTIAKVYDSASFHEKLSARVIIDHEIYGYIIIGASVDKLQLIDSVKSDEDLRIKAENFSKFFQISSFVGCKGVLSKTFLTIPQQAEIRF